MRLWCLSFNFYAYTFQQCNSPYLSMFFSSVRLVERTASRQKGPFSSELRPEDIRILQIESTLVEIRPHLCTACNNIWITVSTNIHAGSTTIGRTIFEKFLNRMFCCCPLVFWGAAESGCTYCTVYITFLCVLLVGICVCDSRRWLCNNASIMWLHFKLR